MSRSRPSVGSVVIEYENSDNTPVYVEGAQGVLTPKGSLQVSFYSENMRPKTNLSTTLDQSGTVVNVKTEDPFGLDVGEIHIVRRIEADLILTLPTLKAVTAWFNNKIGEMEAVQAAGEKS